MSELDPQETPDAEVGKETGQSPESVVTTPAVEPAAVNEVAQKLAELEKQNRELQRRLTQQGRELAEQRRTSSVPKETPNFFENPEAVLEAKLTAFEQRLEQRRQAEQLLRDFAEERGIPVRKLQQLNDEFQGATADPREYLEVLARLHAAGQTAEAIHVAQKATVETVQKNARAVTSETTSAQVSPPGKPIEEMTLEEYRAYLVKKHGEEPLP